MIHNHEVGGSSPPLATKLKITEQECSMVRNHRIENIKNSKATLKFKFKESIHYVASSFLSKNKNFLIESPEKILTLLSIPMGMLLYLYIKIKD